MAIRNEFCQHSTNFLVQYWRARVNKNSQFCVGPVTLPASALEQVGDKQQHDLGVLLVLQARLPHLLHLLVILASNYT